LRWDYLCPALRRQFREARTDLDIREAIRDWKQREREGFDTFYDAKEELMDNLYMPLTETEVVEILKRNLRPEIRHEILNIPVRTVERLREKCRRRESFLEDVRKSLGYQIPFRKQVSELVEV